MDEPKRYSIKDTAKHLGVPASTLRYWEQEGLVRAERNQTNDYRQYTVHHFIDASEIALYRKLGVPVKELRNYRSMSISALDDALGRSEQETQRRITELQALGKRLAHQRAINAQAEELQHAGMRPGAPNVKRFSAIDYDRENLWILFVDEPWRYGVVIEANAPHITQEAVVDTPLVESETFWVHPGEHEPLESLECLLRIDPNTGSSNAEALFTESTERGLQPSRILGTYLLSAVERADDPRWDYYHAWIL